MTSYKHWQLTRDADSIAWLTFDRAEAATNTFSSEVLTELRTICDEITANPPKGVAIRSAKDNGFAAGADIEQFKAIKTPDEAMAFTKEGYETFDKVAALPCPTVALVHGFCMGGATELALACTYRVMDDGAKTRMALPEVMIGIVPGWGGMKRMPKLIGLAAAFDLMLTGKGVDARKARALGLVDFASPRRHFENAARQTLLNPPRPREPKFMQSITNVAPFKSIVAAMSRKQVVKRVDKKHYPAPYAIIDITTQFGGNPLAVPREHPASLYSIFEHPTAKNLIRVFSLQDRLKSLGKVESAAPAIEHVHVVGAGVMGGDIAAWCALRGLTVTLQDVSYERIAPALGRAMDLFKKRLKQAHLVQAANDRLIADVAGDGAAKADLIIEAIVENAEIKKKLYAQIEPRMKPQAILASNTSSIPLEQLCTALTRPERLVGIHFFNPVAQMMLVEVVRGAQTSNDIMQRATAFVKQIDKLPLPCKSSPGFLVNRVLSPYLHEAMLCLDEGIPAEVIDRAAKDFGMPMGPIELADVVGLDICMAVGKELGKPGQTVPRELQKRIDAKELGKKTGKGFYTWAGGKAQKQGASGNGAVNFEELAQRLTLPMMNEAVAAVREGVVEDADLCDAGVIFGTGFAPHRGGPINAIRGIGKETLLAQMTRFRERLGERFTADAGWSTIV